MKKTSDPGPIRRILLITKFRYLGDTIVATPLLRDLASANPEAEITVLGGPAIPALLQDCPYIKESWSSDPRAGSSLRLSRDLIRRIRDQKFDAAFLTNRSLHSAVLAFFAGIPIRIGHDTERRGILLTKRLKYHWAKPDRECALDLARAVGIQTGSSLPLLWVSSAEQDEARALLQSRGVPLDKPLFALHPGAHDPFVREWGAERFAELGNRLAQEIGGAVIIMGGPEEVEVGERTAGRMRQQPAVLSGSTNLRQALALISLCSLWVGNDGGMLHAAVGLDVPTVGIFGPTKAARWGYDTPIHKTLVKYPGPHRGEPENVIRHCLDAITVDEAYEAASSAIENKLQMETYR